MLPTNEEIPLTIDHIYNPRASYAISKIVGESLFINMCTSKNIKFNILRYHNVYGERMGDCHIIPEVTNRIRNAKEGTELDIYGGEQTRSLMYIDDCIRDTIKVCESDFSGEIFNIGCEKEIKIRDVVKDLIHLSGKVLTIQDYGAPSGSVERRLPDMRKFNKYFGLSKNTPFYTGLLKTYNWYIANS
jgi:nucleoside-diphosphate-sugar epimerase